MALLFMLHRSSCAPWLSSRGRLQRARRICEYVATEFAKADLNDDGVIDADEFILYYYSAICFKFPVGKNGFNPGAALYNIFCNYCSFGKGGRRCEEMESHQLLKLCQQCGLLERRRCRKADVDLVFHRARAERITRKVRPLRPLLRGHPPTRAGRHELRDV